MGFSFAPTVKKVAVVLAAVVAVGCTKKDAPKENGTQDTGGGSAQYSTPEQVSSALDRALKLATDPDQQKNIFAQFWIDRGRKNKNAFIKSPFHLFPEMSDPGELNLRAPEQAAKFKSPYLEALVKNRFDRKAKGDCLAKAGMPNNGSSTCNHSKVDK